VIYILEDHKIIWRETDEIHIDVYSIVKHYPLQGHIQKQKTQLIAKVCLVVELNKCVSVTTILTRNKDVGGKRTDDDVRNRVV
jgi:hypothetical protein